MHFFEKRIVFLIFFLIFLFCIYKYAYQVKVILITCPLLTGIKNSVKYFLKYSRFQILDLLQCGKQ